MTKPALETQQEGLPARVAALEDKLVAVTFNADDHELVITGANLRIVNGLGWTGCTDAVAHPIPDCPNGLGNLIVGYNKSRGPINPDNRTGSHNVVVETAHNFSSFGGMAVGLANEISGDYSVVQTSPKSPLRIWGAKPTVPAAAHFDEQPCGATAE